MELKKAREIIDTLAQGIPPVTGEAMPGDSPYNSAAVIRALFAVSKALDTPGKRKPRRPAPANAGKPWSEDDDAALQAAFSAQPLADTQALAGAFGRTRLAVE